MGGRAGFGGSGGRLPKESKQQPQTGQQGFEYDPAKSASNKEKHGVDFEEAKALWNDDKRTKIPSEFIGEERMMTTAKCNGKMYTAVYTERNGSIRIISVRRARENEVNHYETQDD
jgi:uncharacterized DUF497 family protein